MVAIRRVVLVSREIQQWRMQFQGWNVLRKCRLESSGRSLNLSRGIQPSKVQLKVEPQALRLRVANYDYIDILSCCQHFVAKLLCRDDIRDIFWRRQLSSS
jgi:hypothetical protein